MGGLAGTVYQVQSHGLGLAVSVLTADHDISGYQVEVLMRTLVAGLRQQGATQASLGDLRPVRTQGMSGYDGVISFLSADGRTRSYWRLRALHDDHRVVELQVLRFLDPERHSSPDVDRAFTRLVRSFRAG